jgi:hypothetical protein
LILLVPEFGKAINDDTLDDVKEYDWDECKEYDIIDKSNEEGFPVL